jgi:SPP1 gp7 family putative phage head morphogenesis protein
LDYLGLLIHAALLLRRYENAIIREDVDPLFARLQSELAQAARPNLMGADRARIAKVLRETFDKIEQRAGADIVRVAENHAAKVEAAVEHRKAARPNESKIIEKAAQVSRAQQILEQDSFDGATWKRWNEIHRERAARDTEIHTALSRNAKETPAQLRDRLLTRVVRPAQQRARALTRTFSLNIANALSWEQAEADPRVKGYRLLVTLDARTSLVCIAHSAEHKFYKFEAGSPRPPFHYSCRTIIYPVIVGREKEKPRNAEAWLEAKSAADQDEILGEERGELYRAGEISLSGLINSENRVLDLAELRGVSSGSGVR